MLERNREVAKKLSFLEELLLGIFKVGTVVSVNEKDATVRVEFKDREGKVSWDMPVISPHTYADKAYWLPKEGELALCLFPPGHRGFGVVIGSLYNAQDTPPVADRNKAYMEFEDGTRIEYDKSTGKLTVENPKDVVLRVQNSITKETQTLQIKAGASSSLDTPTFTITGEVIVQGNLTVMGNISSIGQTTAQGGVKTSPSGTTVFMDDLVTKFNIHTHTDSAGGSTSVPDQQLP